MPIVASLILAMWGATAARLTAAAEPIGAPVVLYTDLISGPVSGGENDQGAYVSIFGRNFGDAAGDVHVYFGAREAAAYRYKGPSKGLADVQQITVQPGPIGSGPLPIKVVVNGQSSNTDHTFLPNPGKVLFVDNVEGSDWRAHANDIGKPWRHLQTPQRTGALADARPGDVIVLRGKAPWTDVGFENRWVRMWAETGTPPTGKPGTGYITIEAYPGEDVYYHALPDTNGGFQGVSEAGARSLGMYVVLAGLRIESVASSSSDGAPVNLQSSADGWRVVNNDLSWPNARNSARAGGIAGNCRDCKLLGNHVHDIGGGSENHGIYLDGSEYGTAAAEVAYNWIAGIRAGNGIQSYNSHVGGKNEPNHDLDIHDNRIEDGGRYGINLSDGTRSATVHDNSVTNMDYAGLRLNVAYDELHFDIYANEFSNVCRRPTPVSGAVINTWKASSGSILIHDNSFAKGPESTCSDGYVNDGEDSAVSFKSNRWVGFEPPGGKPTS